MVDGFVTQTRDIIGPVDEYSYAGHNAYYSPPQRDFRGSMLGTWSGYATQQTYSYRSGNQFIAGHPEDELGDLPSTDAGTFQFLLKDKETQGFLHPGDTGHIFSTVSTVCNGITKPLVSIHTADNQWRWQGPLIPCRPNPGFIQAQPLGNSTYYGTTAIAATNPSKPSASLADDLGQIYERSFFPEIFSPFRDVVLKYGRYLNIGKVPEQWLNYSFGWLPFKSDVQSLIAAVVSSKRILQQYARDSGNDVRRRYDFAVINGSGSGVCNSPQTTYTTPTANPKSQFTDPSWGTLNILYPNGSYRTNWTQISKQKIWFKGCYVYNLPVSSPTLDFMAKCERLLGVDLTPADVWDLAPWTWLADWQSDIGSVISNASYLAGQKTVLKYGYLMCETTLETVYSAESSALSGIRGLYGINDDIAVFWTSIRKERFRSTPYGFGLDPSSFSTDQWSILGALGLTKAWRTLW